MNIARRGKPLVDKPPRQEERNNHLLRGRADMRHLVGASLLGAALLMNTPDTLAHPTDRHSDQTSVTMEYELAAQERLLPHADILIPIGGRDQPNGAVIVPELNALGLTGDRVDPVHYPAQMAGVFPNHTLTWDQSNAKGARATLAMIMAALEENPQATIIVAGYSQGSAVVALVQQELKALGLSSPNIKFVLLGSPYQPGGLSDVTQGVPGMTLIPRDTFADENTIFAARTSDPFGNTLDLGTDLPGAMADFTAGGPAHAIPVSDMQTSSSITVGGSRVVEYS